MHRDEIRKVVSEQFYNSLTASGVQITAIPSGQLHAFVEAMADGFIAAIAAIEEEGDVSFSGVGAASGASPTPDDPKGTPQSGGEATEVGVWHGRPYLSIGTRYELSNQRLRIHRGVFGNRIEEIELIRVKDTKVTQHMGERMLNIGDVTIVSADPSTPEFVLRNVHDPIYVRELLRKTVNAEKERRGLYYREDIGEEGNDR